MAIDKLLTADKLRFEDLDTNVIATLSTITSDEVEEDMSDGDVEVIVPVYGTPYLKFKNPTGKAFSKGVLKAVSTQAQFDALNVLVSSGNMKVVVLKVGGSAIPERIFMNCVITGVSVKKHLLKGVDWVSGQISFIKV